jgi:transcriptional regulator with XRE-family HTH domain
MGPSDSFGMLLRRSRVAAGLTQEQLAEKAGISRRNLGDLERGADHRPRKDTLALLADALALSMHDRQTLFEAARRLGASSPAVLTKQPAAPALPLVGRRYEMELLERHLAGSGPPALLLAGEPGISKSRLLNEALLRAATSGWVVLHGGCQRQSGQVPFAPLPELIERQLRDRSVAGTRADLANYTRLARLLPDSLSTASVDHPAAPYAPAQEWHLPM